ncbi:MAG: GIY-YIG nuclease family protein [bacterium]|nr:GIY-YIG nuclease family protein [bacterium]MDZ4285378.1 GIY-YIG nuclease family protein [Candidatus Sungbacteria bacterium]
MKFFVYVLKSLKNGDIYIGSTQNVSDRVKLHNTGKVQSTRPNRPWQLLEYETLQSRSEAMRREQFLKTGQQRERLKEKYGVVAKQ